MCVVDARLRIEVGTFLYSIRLRCASVESQ
eukprot:COSAG02_NODE_59051_length_275_cov_0.875000_1_plen_29_part_10